VLANGPLDGDVVEWFEPWWTRSAECSAQEGCSVCCRSQRSSPRTTSSASGSCSSARGRPRWRRGRAARARHHRMKGSRGPRRRPLRGAGARGGRPRRASPPPGTRERAMAARGR
jgi:hypothetical protein